MVTENIAVTEDLRLTEDFFSMENVDWILISTPVPMLTVLLLYLLFVLMGPSFMEMRSPYQLTGLMRLYNIVQVILNGSMFAYPVFWHFRGLYTAIEMSCALPRYSDNILEWRDIFHIGSWGYVCLKILDLFDTVFMILRKKNSRVTFLHVYHHTAMVLSTWFTLKYTHGYQAAVPALINVFVHMVMYSYYFLATFGPQLEQYLWWKKHLTKLQLAQFAVILLYLFMLHYNGCPISKVYIYIWLFNVFVILCLFINFYINAYINKENHKKGSEQSKKQH